MALEDIVIGTANAGQGDTPFDAWTKAKAMFIELYGPRPAFRSGQEYSNNLVGVSLGTQALAVDTLRSFKWTVKSTLDFNRMTIAVTSAVASTSMRVGIYTDLNDYPDDLVAGSDAGVYATTSNADVSSSAVAVTLVPRVYWIGVNCNGTPTLRAWPAGSIEGNGTILGGSVQGGGWTVALAYAAMPAKYPAGATKMSAGTLCTFVSFRKI